ncbi:Bifunctional F420 biosynthesis protein FbiB [Baekduia alba]|uniref:coenzyme F420-0:L-glutamate ligase n=1 Tax=Baekduia alba TaxID=2997333 RepID=UPI0023425250|nr:coenzyme F420-0:L-glutamate ligase [Baekduia alba]WCB93241.1 Bifunctional F420 biosynthesis protein FbiB [Baekduia alba]
MTLVTARALAGLPEVRAGDDLAALIAGAHGAGGFAPGAVLVVAHKVVSKAEGRVVALRDVVPGERALTLAAQLGKDPRQVEVILRESAEVVRAEHGVLISRTHHGFVCANAGVDASNAAAADELILLPVDPDASARALRGALGRLGAGSPAVLIADSFGRAWRHGQCDVAVGIAGLAPLEDWRGRTDAHGRALRATWIAIADQAAAAADLARGGKDAGEPAVVVTGLERHVLPAGDDGPGVQALVRGREEDLFG